MNPSYRPSRLLRNPHLMTLVGVEWPRRLGDFAKESEEAILRVDDETEVKVEFHREGKPGAPALLLVHGLNGDANRGYMLGMAARARQEGFTVVRLNTRNCGGTERLSKGLFHAAIWQDIEAAFRFTVDELGARRVGLVGFSLGGAQIAHLLAHWGTATPTEAARFVSVSAPFDLRASSDALHASFPRRLFYMGSFLRAFRRMWKSKHALWPEEYPASIWKHIHTLREFDEQVTAPRFHFGGADDYYAKAAAAPVLPEVSVPGLILQAENDPLAPLCPETLDVLRSMGNVDLELVPSGGHVVFLAEKSFSQQRWGETRILDDLVTHLRPAG